MKKSTKKTKGNVNTKGLRIIKSGKITDGHYYTDASTCTNTRITE